MMEAPCGNRGSAFCTVNSRPLTLVLNVLSKCSSVIARPWGEFSTASIGKDDIEMSLLLLDSGEQPIEVWQIRDIALNTCDIFTNLFYGSIQFTLTTTRDEDIGTFGDKALSSRKTDAAAAAGDKSDFSF